MKGAVVVHKKVTEKVKEKRLGLAGGGFADFGGFAVFADEGDEGLGGAGQAAVAAIDEAELAPEVHTFDGQQLHFAGLHIVFCKTLADDGEACIGGDEAFDHADARQFHGHVEARAEGAQKLVEHLASEAGTRKNERLSRDLRQRNFRTMRERIFGADHEAQAVFVNLVHFEVGRLDGKRDDADIDGAVFDALKNLVAEIAVDADVHERVAALKFGKNIGEQIEAGGFVGAENNGALHDVAAVRDHLDGLVAHAKKFLGVFEQNFTRGGQLDGLGGAIEKAGLVRLFELANLSADSGLRAEYFLARTGKTLEFSDVNESCKLIEVHSQIARQGL